MAFVEENTQDEPIHDMQRGSYAASDTSHSSVRMDENVARPQPLQECMEDRTQDLQDTSPEGRAYAVSGIEHSASPASAIRLVTSQKPIEHDGLVENVHFRRQTRVAGDKAQLQDKYEYSKYHLRSSARKIV